MARKKEDTTIPIPKSKKDIKQVYVGTTPVNLTDPTSINTTLRLTSPKMGEAADYKNSKSYAIKGKCMDCSGGNRAAVEACPVQACFLWPHRPFKDSTARAPGVVPTLEEYRLLKEAKESKYDRSAALAALKSHREDDEDDNDNDSEGVEVEIEYE